MQSSGCTSETKHSQGMKAESARCREKKHYEILKKSSQNMAPNIRKFWKKEAQLKAQAGVTELLLFWGRDNETPSGSCRDRWRLQTPRPKGRCEFGANVSAQWKQKWKKLRKWPQPSWQNKLHVAQSAPKGLQKAALLSARTSYQPADAL